MFPKVKPAKKLIYLDHAATTPIRQEVVKASSPFWSANFGNPSSLYRQGRAALSALNAARSSIAGLLAVKPSEIIFTAGGTESVNLAILGVARAALRKRGKAHVISTAIEHHAVLKAVEELKKEGCSVSVLPVDAEGFVNISALEKAIRPETILVSVMYANNEIGTVEPIGKIGKLLARVNQKRRDKGLPEVLFHTDACQAAGSLDVNAHRLGVDLLSANGSKLYGPKQVGFLYARTGIELLPLVFGGGQEKNLRSGTENVAGAVGLAKALELSHKEREKENKRLKNLRDYFITKLLAEISGAILNGPDERTAKKREKEILRLSNNVHISIPGVEGEALTLYLDSYNIAVSTGSACTTGTTDPSHVVMALGKSKVLATQSVRFTLGASTTKQDLDYVLKVLPGICSELKNVVKL